MNFAHDQSFSLTQHNWELPTLMEALFHRYTKANGFGPPPTNSKGKLYENSGDDKHS